MDSAFANDFRMHAREYRDFSVETEDITLRRPQEGKNIELVANGHRYEIGRITRAFPLSSALEPVVFFDAEGEEIGLMKQVGLLDSDSHNLLAEELEKSYFMPRINSIKSMEETLGIETWTVVTNKGLRAFEVEDATYNVRAIGEGRVLVKDVDGNRYEIQNWRALDRKSIGLLMKYL